MGAHLLWGRGPANSKGPRDPGGRHHEDMQGPQGMGAHLLWGRAPTHQKAHGTWGKRHGRRTPPLVEQGHGDIGDQEASSGPLTSRQAPTETGPWKSDAESTPTRGVQRTSGARKHKTHAETPQSTVCHEACGTGAEMPTDALETTATDRSGWTQPAQDANAPPAQQLVSEGLHDQYWPSIRARRCQPRAAHTGGLRKAL